MMGMVNIILLMILFIISLLYIFSMLIYKTFIEYQGFFLGTCNQVISNAGKKHYPQRAHIQTDYKQREYDTTSKLHLLTSHFLYLLINN